MAYVKIFITADTIDASTYTYTKYCFGLENHHDDYGRTFRYT